MSDIPADSPIAASRERAEALLKTALQAIDRGDFSSDLSVFMPFAHSVKLLFYEEAAALLSASEDQAVFEQDVRRLLDRILDEYTKAPATKRLTERQRKRLERPMPLDKRMHIEPRDKWDIFSPVLFLPNKKDAVRRELKSVLGGELAYWLREGASRFSGAPHFVNAPPGASESRAIATDSDETDQFFSAYQKTAKKSDQAVEAIKRIHAAPKMRVNYLDLVNTIWEVWKIAPKDVSRDDVDHALYLLARKYEGGVELDPVSCPWSSAQSGSLGIRFRGPDEIELLIEPYDDGYVWRIRNGQLQAVERIRFEILGVQTFDAEKAAFREATTTFRGYWTPIYKLLPGELTKGVILVAFEGDGLRLGQTAGMNSLSWPSGDPNEDRRWLLNTRVAGLSREWPIQLDLRWTLGTKTLWLLDYPGNKTENAEPPALHSQGNPTQGVQVQESHDATLSEAFDFSSEQGRVKAIADYTHHWTTELRTCSEASLARSAMVDPADLSKWKKGLLPTESDKKSRIERVLRNNEVPKPMPKKLGEE